MVNPLILKRRQSQIQQKIQISDKPSDKPLTNPRYNEQISSVPWHYVKSKVHCKLIVPCESTAEEVSLEW